MVYYIYRFSGGFVRSVTPRTKGNEIFTETKTCEKHIRYKIVNQKNTIKPGPMLDDMHQIHVHIMTLQRRYYRIYGPNISAYTMKKHITKLKQRTKPHWKQLPSQVAQDVALRPGKSYDAFFRNIGERNAGTTTRKVGLPHIKPRHKYNSMTFPQAGYKLEGNRIKINCIDTWFTFHKHRVVQGTIKTVIIKRDRKIGQWTATTKPCSDCGYHNKNLSLDDRQWTCPKCGSNHDRNINAAINIRQAGLDACGWSDNKTLSFW